MQVTCPTCRKVIEYSTENSYRPFCSERCQTLDLGAWADEQFRIPLPESESPAVNEIPDDDES